MDTRHKAPDPMRIRANVARSKGVRHAPGAWRYKTGEGYRRKVYHGFTAPDVARFVGYCDQNLGWYVTDEGWSGEVVRGVVFRLTHGRGFLYGYEDPWNEGMYIVASDIAETEADASRWADHMAEAYAEDAREHDRAFQAASRWYDIGGELEDVRAHIRKGIAAIRQGGPPDTLAILWEYLEERLAERRSLHADRARIVDENDGPAFADALRNF